MEKQCKKVSLIGMMLLLWGGSLFAQGPDTLWTRIYGGTDYDRSHSVQQTSDGGYIVAGWTHSFGAGSYDVYLIKTDASGDTLWTKAYGGVNGDYGYSVQQTSDSGYIIVGYTYSFCAGGGDVYLIKTDVSGDILWTKTYGGAKGDYGYSVQQTSDGGYIIAGYTYSFCAGGSDVYLIKTDASGDILWTKTYGGAKGDYGYSVQQTSDGGYIIAGCTYSFGAGSYDVYLIKTDASGDILWTKTYGGTSSDYGLSVQQISDGGYIIAGCTYSFGAGSYDVYLIKTDASGDTLWTKTYGGVNGDYGLSVQQISDGGYIIAGYTHSFGAGGGDVYLIKTDASGDILWTKTYGGASGDYGRSCQQTSDGGYIITGYTYSFGAGSSDIWLIKTEMYLSPTPDLDIQDYSGNLSANTMELTGVCNSVIVGSYVLVNPDDREMNVDLYDGPGNSDLNLTYSCTDLLAYGEQHSIPTSSVDPDVIGVSELALGTAARNIVQVYIPSVPPGTYVGTVTATGSDAIDARISNSDEFTLKIEVIFSNDEVGLPVASFCGNPEEDGNYLYWANFGLGETGFNIYRSESNPNFFSRLNESSIKTMEYRDRDVIPGKIYEYKLGLSIDGSSEILLGPLALTSIGGDKPVLAQNRPNPWKVETEIYYAVPANSKEITLKIYNIAGELIKTLIEGSPEPGFYTVLWDGRDETGKSVSSGVYFYKLTAGSLSQTRKMLLFR